MTVHFCEKPVISRSCSVMRVFPQPLASSLKVSDTKVEKYESLREHI